MARDVEGEVVYLVRDEESSLRYLFVGAVIGAAAALLLAPASGSETRRSLRRKANDLRHMAQDGLEQLEERVSEGAVRVKGKVRNAVDEVRTSAGEVTDAVKGAGRTAREELEQRLSAARARRGAGPESVEEEEEPVA